MKMSRWNAIAKMCACLLIGTASSVCADVGRSAKSPDSNALGSWAGLQSVGGKRVQGKNIPKAARAHLVKLVRKSISKKVRIRWVRVVGKDGDRAPTVALSYGYSQRGVEGRQRYLGFAMATGVPYRIPNVFEVVRTEKADWQFGSDRDIDLDEVPDTIVSYYQESVSGAEAGLIVLPSQSATVAHIPLLHQVKSKTGGTRDVRPWSACWIDAGQVSLALVIVHEHSRIKQDGTRRSRKFSASAYGVPYEESLRKLPVYGAIVAQGKSAAALQAKLRLWSHAPSAQIARPPKLFTNAWAPPRCGGEKGLADTLIVPKMVTRPKGGRGYYVLSGIELSSHSVVGNIMSKEAGGSLSETPKVVRIAKQ